MAELIIVPESWLSWEALSKQTRLNCCSSCWSHLAISRNAIVSINGIHKDVQIHAAPFVFQVNWN